MGCFARERISRVRLDDCSPVSFVPPVLWVQNGCLLLSKTIAPLGWSLSQAQLLVVSMIGFLTLPLQGSRTSNKHPLLVFLDSAHALIVCETLLSLPIWGCHLLSAGTLTRTVLDILYLYIIYLLPCIPFICCMWCIP